MTKSYDCEAFLCFPFYDSINTFYNERISICDNGFARKFSGFHSLGELDRL